MHATQAEAQQPQWPMGGGDTGALCRALDWSHTALGNLETWSSDLRTSVDIVLNSPMAMVLMWGSDHVMIYNDGYVPIAASKHPQAFGGTVQDIWPEIWDWNREMLAAGLRGESRVFRDQMLQLERDGRLEDVWFDLYYTPVRGADGAVAGVLCTAPVITDRMLAQKRAGFLLNLSERLRGIGDPSGIMASAAAALGTFLDASRVGYGHADADNGTITVDTDWTDGSLPSISGLSGAIDATGPSLAASIRSGGTIRIDDIDQDARTTGHAGQFHSIGTRALLIVPLVNDGVLTAVFYVHRATATHWADSEISIVEDVAARTWSAVVRTQAERELRQSEERLRIAQAAGGVGSFELLPEKGRIVVSEQFCRLWGIPKASELVLADVINIVHPDDRGLIRTGDPSVPDNALQPTEYRIVRPDTGEVRWMARRGEVLRDPSGKLRYLGVSFDITDRKRAEMRLRQLNESLEASVAEKTAERDRVWQNSRDLLVVVGADGIFRAVNPAWTAILGHDAADVAGHSFLDFIWPDDIQLSREGMRKAFTEGGLTDFELRFRHRDGRPLWLSWRTSLEGDTVYAYGRDITAEKEQKAALHLAEEQLRQAQKMEAVGQLTGGIAHDFNNLLMGISGALDMLNRRISEGRTEGLARYIEIAKASSSRAAALTQRLLAFARRQPLDARHTDINQLIWGMADAARGRLGEAIRLDISTAPDLWNTVCDPHQLETALFNLAGNARDAMPEGGTLSIATENFSLDTTQAARMPDPMPAGDYVLITVTDTGTGMTPAIQARAFEPFFTTKGIGQGSGLGLSMVYGFIRQTGGHVELSSAPDHGTRIRIFLPRAA